MKKAAARHAQHRQEIADDVRDQKRERILEAAEDLFFRHGYAGTTIADIVDELGVTKPYLYYYFNNKNEIFETLCWRSSVACLTSMRFGADDARPAVEKLRDGLHRFAAANIAYFKAGTFAYREGAALDPALMKSLRAMARRFYRELGALLEQARKSGDCDFDNAKLTALAIGGVATSLYTWYKPDGSIAPGDMVDQLTRIMLKIAGAQPAPAKTGQKRKATTSKKAQP
ncbi:TetR/AcrR family transcriptional regulator [Noviherbaspirillum sp. UKPF54]|uniref:TetR/AcrR family transcriptional regulator n=1 Tax=Noviherbaspirillum sp. UKPF54 TaxID=2601898 RepID=UPI0011B0FFE2|nr:TetR/AcrR family transcriptional regulator [Noviherbaspirillum sp. UKPF54]QDZ26687.1 TetR/AcrR family transcriptional regulator [Noviherbaspirillum sp. UKPF54]